MFTRRAVVAGTAAGTLALAVDPAFAQRCPQRRRPVRRGRWSGAIWISRHSTRRTISPSMPSIAKPMNRRREREAIASALARIGPPHASHMEHRGDREGRHLPDHRAECADLDLHSWRRWSTGRASVIPGSAEMFVKAGAHFVAVDFSSVDDTGGDLTKLVDQCRRAVGFVHRNAANFGGNADRIYLADIPPAPISRLACSRPSGRKKACRRTSSKARCSAAACTISNPCVCRVARSFVKFTDEIGGRR